MKNQITNFKQHLISLSKSQNTIRNYTTDVTHYFEMFDTINRENILKYKDKISSLATSTINCKLSSLKSFNEYLLLKGLIEFLAIIKSDFIKQQGKGNPTDVTEKQVTKFLNRVNTKDNIYKSRNVAIIYLIANTGIRREEITNLKLKNLDLENGELILLGKGNKERTVLLNDKAIDVIKDWLKDRVNFKHAAKSEYIFVSERSEKLHKDSINGIF
jgi:integrase/recombinase XerD